MTGKCDDEQTDITFKKGPSLPPSVMPIRDIKLHTDTLDFQLVQSTGVAALAPIVQLGTSQVVVYQRAL